MAVKFDSGKYIETYTNTKERLQEVVSKSLSDYFKGITSELYKLLVKNSITHSEYNKIVNKMQGEIGIYTTDVSTKIKKIYKDILTESRINNPKYKQSILDYELSNTLSSITNEFNSAYNDVKTALDHTKHVMDMQTSRDAKALLNNMKSFTPEKIEKNMQAFKEVFQNDYGQRYMQQLTENPLLNRLISQDDDKLYITLNGKKFDLEKLCENQASHYTTQTMHEISQAESKEKGFEVFRFVRVSPVENQREHSIHDNEHNDDYFTTNPDLVGTEYDGKILLDAYTAIEDYHYGEQPPYGCQHIFVGVEEDKLTPIKSYDENIKSLSKIGITVENGTEDKNFILNEISEAFSYLQHDFKKLSKDYIPKIIRFDSERFKHDFGKDYKKVVAGFDKTTKMIFINKEADVLANEKILLKYSVLQKHEKFYSTPKPCHFFVHEYYHFNTWTKHPKLYSKLEGYEFNDTQKNIIRKFLGKYACENGLEFVAEYETKKLFNLEIDEILEKIYSSLMNLS